MKVDRESACKNLINVKKAIQRGDRRAARSWAEQAVAQAPDSEEPWLFLAALASPRASIRYLEQALKINPGSQRARKGMHWAAERLRRERTAKSSEELAQIRLEPRESPGRNKLGQYVSEKPVISNPPPKSLFTIHWSFLTLVLLAICITAVWAFWPGSASPVLAFLHASPSTPQIPGVLAEVIKPTYTPSATPTFTPTATFTPTPTFTFTPTPTDTPTPTETLTPSETPPPTNTEIPWPTDTPEPIVNSGGGGGVHWIDVDLSQQMLYAYEGNTVVASFLVSTGVSQFPTVTGQFHIYIKLISTLMAGDGYYLPEVPYTMYFYKGYGIHGTYWHNNFGHPMSHGCVNMYTPDAEWMYYWTPLGTLVNVHY